MASLGTGSDDNADKTGSATADNKNLVAIDNFVIKKITNDSRTITEFDGLGPAAEIEDQEVISLPVTKITCFVFWKRVWANVRDNVKLASQR